MYEDVRKEAGYARDVGNQYPFETGEYRGGLDAAKREPEISGKLASLENAIKGLQAGIAQLGGRLMPVSRQELKGQQAGQLGPAAPVPSHTEIGGRILANTHIIQSASDEVQDMIRRLEI